MLSERSITQKYTYYTILYNSIYTKFYNKQTNLRWKKKSKQWLPLGSGWWCLIGKRHEGTSRIMVMFYIGTQVWLTNICIYQNLANVCMICEFYFYVWNLPQKKNCKQIKLYLLICTGWHILKDVNWGLQFNFEMHQKQGELIDG